MFGIRLASQHIPNPILHLFLSTNNTLVKVNVILFLNGYSLGPILIDLDT